MGRGTACRRGVGMARPRQGSGGWGVSGVASLVLMLLLLSPLRKRAVSGGRRDAEASLLLLLLLLPLPLPLPERGS